MAAETSTGVTKLNELDLLRRLSPILLEAIRSFIQLSKRSVDAQRENDAEQQQISSFYTTLELDLLELNRALDACTLSWADASEYESEFIIHPLLRVLEDDVVKRIEGSAQRNVRHLVAYVYFYCPLTRILDY